MPIQLRVIETRRSRGHTDITLDAPSTDQAAAIIADAHDQAVRRGSPVIELPDGQSIVIEQSALDTTIELRLLDEDGRDVQTIDVPKRRAGRAK